MLISLGCGTLVARGKVHMYIVKELGILLLYLKSLGSAAVLVQRQSGTLESPGIPRSVAKLSGYAF